MATRSAVARFRHCLHLLAWMAGVHASAALSSEYRFVDFDDLPQAAFYNFVSNPSMGSPALSLSDNRHVALLLEGPQLLSGQQQAVQSVFPSSSTLTFISMGHTRVQNNGDILFHGITDTSERGWFRLSGGSVEPVLKIGDCCGYGSNPLVFVTERGSATASGHIAFLGARQVPGRLSMLMREPDGRIRPFGGLEQSFGYLDGSNPVASPNGRMAVIARAMDPVTFENTVGLFVENGGSKELLITSSPTLRLFDASAPDGWPLFVGQQVLAVNDAGDVAFTGIDEQGRFATYVHRDGQLEKVFAGAYTRRNFDAASLEFALTADGTLLYESTINVDDFALAKPEGIFSYGRDGHRLIIGPGSELFGSTLEGVSFSRNAVNAHGEFAFLYALRDGRIGVALAVPVPEPGPLLLLAIGIATLAMAVSVQRSRA